MYSNYGWYYEKVANMLFIRKKQEIILFKCKGFLGIKTKGISNGTTLLQCKKVLGAWFIDPQRRNVQF